MGKHATKSQAAKGTIPNAEASHDRGPSEAAFQFVDLRPQTQVQRRLQSTVRDSKQVQRAAAAQKLANESSVTQKAKVIQQKVHQKFAADMPIQRMAYHLPLLAPWVTDAFRDVRNRNEPIQRNKITYGGIGGALIGGLTGALYGGLTAGPAGALAGALYGGVTGALALGTVGAVGGAIAERRSPTRKKKIKVDSAPFVTATSPRSRGSQHSGRQPARKVISDEKESKSMASSSYSHSEREKTPEELDAERGRMEEILGEIALLSQALGGSKYAAKISRDAPENTLASHERRLGLWQEAARKENESRERAAKQSGSGVVEPPINLAEQARQARIKPYLDLLGHLAGENEKDGTVKGGHLLTAMQAKYQGALIVEGDQSNQAPWEGQWGIQQGKLKRSTFFPANWTIADLTQQLRGSSVTRMGLSLPSGISVRKAGGTFYPILGGED